MYAGELILTFSSSFQPLVAPCKPENTSVDQNCSSNAVTVKWNQASTTQNYTVKAASASGVNSTCDSTQSSCSFLDLSCGQRYTFTVMGHTNVCMSEISAPVEMFLVQYLRHYCCYNVLLYSAISHVLINPTGPCQPSSIEAVVDCQARSAVVSWLPAIGADFYVAALKASSGHISSCITNHTNCEPSPLQCGQEYNVTVMALGDICNSSAVMTGYLSTGTVQDVHLLELVASQELSTSYSVEAVTAQGLTVICNTTNTSCFLMVSGLMCGTVYSVWVKANTQCVIICLFWGFNHYLTHPVSSAPCLPQEIQVDVDCNSDGAARSDVELYVGSAVKASGGEVRKCNSTGSSCQFAGLDCGETYNLTITAHVQGCRSQASTTPCQPVIVSAQAVCQSDEVQISWNQANDVLSYLVTATGSLGYVEIHNTTQTLLSATLPCGQNYSVTVQVLSCPSPAPCIPWDVATYVECEFNVGSVSWGPSDGAEEYVAVATGLDGHPHQCLTNTTSCTWSDLHCGEEYTVVVRAKGDSCTSLPSNSSVIHMVPCVPTNVLVVMDCANNTAAVSWSASRGAVQYSVTALGSHSNDSCQSSGLSCSLRNLTCGSSYTVQVVAMDDDCSSIPSQALVFNSGERCNTGN
uniref:Fibronectin type-III domain-containing protein n=1 Tax=Stegastes partitus TaxID=144197 RepID=A0A3B5BI78_9TELE